MIAALATLAWDDFDHVMRRGFPLSEWVGLAEGAISRAEVLLADRGGVRHTPRRRGGGRVQDVPCGCHLPHVRVPRRVVGVGGGARAGEHPCGHAPDACLPLGGAGDGQGDRGAVARVRTSASRSLASTREDVRSRTWSARRSSRATERVRESRVDIHESRARMREEWRL